MKEILAAIAKHREERGWTEYQLAERSGLPQSTISSWYRNKNTIPTVPSLKKICDCFGITLSQLFATGEEAVSLTSSQKQLISRWSCLTKEQQDAVFLLIERMQ